MNHKALKKFPSNKHLLLSKKGLDCLRLQLKKLRKEQVSLYKRLMGMDVKEREEYIFSTDISNKLEIIEQEVEKISDVLQNSEVIPKTKRHTNIDLGSTVFLESSFKKANFTLVNSIEADPSANKISDVSPLGRALIGRKIHSTVSVSTPKGKKVIYKILAVK